MVRGLSNRRSTEAELFAQAHGGDSDQEIDSALAARDLIGMTGRKSARLAESVAARHAVSAASEAGHAASRKSELPEDEEASITDLIPLIGKWVTKLHRKHHIPVLTDALGVYDKWNLDHARARYQDAIKDGPRTKRERHAVQYRQWGLRTAEAAGFMQTGEGVADLITGVAESGQAAIALLGAAGAIEDWRRYGGHGSGNRCVPSSLQAASRVGFGPRCVSLTLAPTPHTCDTRPLMSRDAAGGTHGSEAAKVRAEMLKNRSLFYLVGIHALGAGR